MPYTVMRSFDLFRERAVDIELSKVAKARKSRDYLIEQIRLVAQNDAHFPRLYGGFQPYGSFARSTKTKPLNDIDLLVLLNGKGTLVESQGLGRCRLQIDQSSGNLNAYVGELGYLNSIKVLNKFKSSLAAIPLYSRADIKRNGVAVVLTLSSYEWSFDIVPAFPVGDSQGPTHYYIIPDGQGEWMKTDPRRDKELVTEVNQRHGQLILPLIRLAKYWNTENRLAPVLPSYYLETMLLMGFRYAQPIASIHGGLTEAFRNLQSRVTASCPDPKGLGDNLDASVDWNTRNKVSLAAAQMAQLCYLASTYERQSDLLSAIKCWSQVFPDFPAYG